MRRNVTLSMDADLIDALKSQAAHRKMPYSQLAETILREALHSPRAALQTAPKLTRREAAVMDAIKRRTTHYATAVDSSDVNYGTRFFALPEIQRAAGLYPTETLDGLRGLERKGLAVCILRARTDIISELEDPPQVDHWSLSAM